MWNTVGRCAAVWLLVSAPAHGEEGPTTIRVPYGPPDEETVYYHHSYREPGTDDVLQIPFTTANTPDTLLGSRTYKLWYRISNDGGRRFGDLRQLIQSGEGFDKYRPVRGIDVRKVGFVTSRQAPFRASNGEIMVPIELWRLDEKGEVYNPAHPYTYCDSAVLIGRWSDDRRDVRWDMGERLQLKLDQSTAGAYEPGLVELSTPGHFAISLRASNIFKPEMPSYKWIALSRDSCRTWSEPRPLTDTDGKRLFSPSSASEFFRHSKGRLYWIGNIIPRNAEGNTPRDPLVIAEFDEPTLSLKAGSMRVLFTRDPKSDSPQVQFSNFTVREDPKTARIHVRLQRFDPGKIPEGYEGNVNFAPFPYSETSVAVE